LLRRIEIAVKVSTLIIFFIIWHILAVLRAIPMAIPSPAEIIATFTSPIFTQYLPSAVYNSLKHVGFGFSITLAVAIPLGMIMGWSRAVRSFVEPIIELFRPIPPIAWVAFALITFRNYLHVSGFIIFIGAFFPVLTNTYGGFKSVPIEYLEVARSLGANRKDLLMKIAFPYALPAILTGIRIGLGVGWMCVIAAEMFGAPGLGWMMMQMEYLHNLAGVMAYMFIVGAFGFCMEYGLKIVEARLLKWQKGLIRG